MKICTITRIRALCTAQLKKRVNTSQHLLFIQSNSHSSYSTTSKLSVYSWGTGTKGQLGHGTFAKSGVLNSYESLAPKRIDAFEGKKIVQIDCGATHCAAIDEDGKLYTWGDNKDNKLGLGPNSKPFEDTPQVVTAFNGHEIASVSCGHHHTAAVDKEGRVFTWGWGGSTMKGAGALGHGGEKEEPIPRVIKSLLDQGVPMKTVQCGEFHSIGLTTDGELWAWGNGEYGRLGNGGSDTCEVPEPMDFFARSNVKSIAVGRNFTFAIDSTGECYAWGSNSRNQLGIGGGLNVDVYNMEAIPSAMEGFQGMNVTQIAAGYYHGAAITDDGKLFMWGSKLWLEPHEMVALSGEKIVQVACGRDFTLAVSDNGKIFSFGRGRCTALGHGDKANQLQPVQIDSLAQLHVTGVAAGDFHATALIMDTRASDQDFSLRK